MPAPQGVHPAQPGVFDFLTLWSADQTTRFEGGPNGGYWIFDLDAPASGGL